MAQQSKHGGTFVNDSGTDWTNPSNAGASDDRYATTFLMNEYTSSYLKITNFGFSIPSGATINWIKVSIERKASITNRVRDSSVKLVKDGTISGNDKATTTYWGTSDSSEDHGGTDTWGVTLTANDINSSSFGCVISVTNPSTVSGATAYIDDVIITVDYTLSLTITDLTHSCSFNNLGLTQVHNLSLENVIHPSLFNNTDLIQNILLILQDLTHSHSFNNIDLIQNILLILQDLTHSHQIDNVTLIISGLVIQNLTHSSLIDNINLTQIHNLTLQDLTHSNLIDSINLITGITLVLSDLIHSGVIDSVNLTQVHNLVVQNTTHQNQIENTILEVMLYIQNATHNGVINNVVLTQIHNLIVNNLSHLNKMDNLDLIQQYILAIQDICHYLKIDTTKLLAWLLKEDGGAVWSRQPDEGSNWKKRN